MKLLVDEWRVNPITRALIQHLRDKRDDLLIELENMSRAEADEVADGLTESVVLRHLADSLESGNFIELTNIDQSNN